MAELDATLRRNPFTGGKDELIIVSPRRMGRPWQGKTETKTEEALSEYDPNCGLCPGNTRKSGAVNPDYSGVFIFENDTPALLPPKLEDSHENQHASLRDQVFYQERSVHGICEVVVYTPDHNKKMMHLNGEEREEVVRAWMDQYRRLGNESFVRSVAQFETNGLQLGNSSPHGHGQTWATDHVPPVLEEELRKHDSLTARLKEPAMLAFLDEELKRDERVIFANNNFGVLVPPWAVYPYELLVIPTHPVTAIDQFTDAQVTDFAQVLKLVPTLYAEKFDRPQDGASYMMGIHQQPTDGGDYQNFQMHFHYASPMLNSQRQKFFAGYEEFFGFQRDLTPEQAARELKSIAATLEVQ